MPSVSSAAMRGEAASDPRLRLGASSRRCAAVFARLGFLGCASVPRFTTTALGSASVSSSARAPLRAFLGALLGRQKK
ncbi:hypothetical protein M885DRAFT_540678, partial [Pelagophyceae sp. CCMP2097]